MEILIVNCNTNNDKNLINSYKQNIIKICKKYSIDNNLKVFNRNFNDIDDFIFEEDSKYTNESAIYRFDSIEFVFIIGSNILPWIYALDKLRILIKMCLKTNKCLFCTADASLILCYLCHIGDKKYKVINGKGNSYNDIYKYKCKNNEVFFDNQYGKFYSYNDDKNEWNFSTFCGIISKHSMLGKKHIYDPKYPIHLSLSHPIYSSTWECQCSIRPEQISHWLINKVRHKEFTVPIHSHWYMVNNTPIYHMNIICENNKHPILFECGNLIGAQFEIDQKYPETINILESFIMNKYSTMRNYGNISSSAVKMKRFIDPKRPFSSKKRPTSAPFNRDKNDGIKELDNEMINNKTYGKDTHLLHMDSVYNNENKNVSNEDCDFYTNNSDSVSFTPSPPSSEMKTDRPIIRYYVNKTPYTRYRYFVSLTQKDRENNNNRFKNIRRDGQEYTDQQHKEYIEYRV